MNKDGYMSCAACHFDGGNDGQVWDLTNLGEGFRNTISLKGKAGMEHGNLHWSKNFDEIHDFENQIRALNEGEGLLNDTDFNATKETLSLQGKELELIKKSLERHRGKRKAAAEELGISERTLYRKIKQYDL